MKDTSPRHASWTKMLNLGAITTPPFKLLKVQDGLCPAPLRRPWDPINVCKIVWLSLSIWMLGRGDTESSSKGRCDRSLWGGTSHGGQGIGAAAASCGPALVAASCLIQKGMANQSGAG